MSLMKVVLTAVVASASLAAVAQTPSPAAVQGNRPPTVKLTPATGRVIVGCEKAMGALCRATSPEVRLTAAASDPDGDTLLYTYLTTGGILSGDGANTTLDVKGVAPGYYTVTVEVSDGRGGTASDKTTVTVEHCICDPPPPLSLRCPTVVVSCPDESELGKPVPFTVVVSGGDTNVTPTFTWTVSAGTISSGKGTSSITVDVTGVADGATVTATVDVGGYDRACMISSSCTLNICQPPPPSRKVDEYGNVRVGDEKQRLDNFTVELQNDPTAQGYLICYGGRRGRAGEARRRCERARTYLISTRGIEASRVVTVDGGARDVLTLELWLVPSGVTPPQPTPTVFPKVRGRR